MVTKKCPLVFFNENLIIHIFLQKSGCGIETLHTLCCILGHLTNISQLCCKYCKWWMRSLFNNHT